jgi:hypothetical protein
LQELWRCWPLLQRILPNGELCYVVEQLFGTLDVLLHVGSACCVGFSTAWCQLLQQDSSLQLLLLGEESWIKARRLSRNNLWLIPRQHRKALMQLL